MLEEENKFYSYSKIQIKSSSYLLLNALIIWICQLKEELIVKEDFSMF